MRYALDETRPEWIAGFCCYRLLLKAGSRDVQVRAVRELQRRGAALDARVERRIRRTRGHARADDSAAFDGYANVERRALRRGATTEPGAVFEHCRDGLGWQIGDAAVAREIDVLARGGERGFARWKG